jgi:hypothetical protein
MTEQERDNLLETDPEAVCWEEGHDWAWGYCQRCGQKDWEYFVDYDLDQFED